MSTIAKSKSMSKLLKFIVMIVLTIGIGMLPPFGGITPMGMKILGVFIGTLFGWMFIDFVVSSTVGLVFLGLTGYTTIMGAFQAGFSDTVVMNMFIAFGFVALLNEVNLTGALASWLLSFKFVKGHPWRIVGLLLFAAWFLAAFADTLPGILLFWSITYKIADDVGYARRSKDVGYLVTGIIFFAAMGTYMFPFKPGVLAFSGGYVAVMGEIPQGKWYFGFVILSVMLMILYLVLGKLIRFDAKKMDIDLADFAVQVGWGKKEKWGLAFVVFFIFFMAIPGFLPATIPWAATWKSFGIIGTTIILVAAAYLITVDGEALIKNPAKLWVNGVNWDLIFMISATMPIGAAIRSDEAGIITTLLVWLEGAIGGMNWILFTIVCMIALGLLTQVSHNLIIAAVLFPVFAPMCAEMGGDPVLWFFANFFAINASFTTPAASGWSAMLHSNSEWVSVKEAYGFGFSTLIVTWLAVLIVIPIWIAVF